MRQISRCGQPPPRFKIVSVRIHLGLVLTLSLLATPASADAPVVTWPGGAAQWARDLDRSGKLLRGAALNDSTGPADRHAALRQMRSGAECLHALALAAITPDSVYSGYLGIQPSPVPRQGQWGNRFVRTTSLVAMSCGMTNLVMGMKNADPEMRQTLGNVAGIVGGTGGMFNMVRPRPKPAPWVDPNEKMRMLIRDTQLRDVFSESSRRLRELAVEFASIAPDSAMPDSAAAELTHRYAGAVDRVSAMFDVEVPHEATVGRAAAAEPQFNTAARARLAGHADHLDAVIAQWREWRWLVGKSQRAALEWRALTEQR